ncbi:PAN domain-containing protein [Jiella sonneratiae]|uniref:PAN domain-containing protein n=1 Tax=Jiella sonneratiae TaxID=2816856 RepID=UPI00315AEC63
MILRIIGWLLAALVVLSPAASVAGTKAFGAFSVDDAAPDVITMRGAIDAGAALNFRRALAAAPEAELLVLDSPGGLVAIGLLIADDVHQRKLATLIPAGSGCYSACAFVFLAGHERQADGELGVHQISSDSTDLVSAQLSISDILDVLGRFDTPTEVLTAMFKTPPDDMHVFTKAEVEQFGINRRQNGEGIAATAPVSATSAAPRGSAVALGGSKSDDVDASEPAAPSLPAASTSRLSALEEYARRPTRMALHAGLDFYGGDIASLRTGDAAACARQCLSMTGTCKAFTFNTNERIVSGPNCFLKSEKGIVDGNMVAISGELLTSADRDPGSFVMGVIDPKASVFDNVDLPGGDLSRRPAAGAYSKDQCRLACVENDRCLAFTFVAPKRECWLKWTIGTPRYRDGMVSGAKKLITFEAATIVELE